MAEVTLSIKLGAQEQQVAMPATATVSQLKQKLEPLMGLMQRQQKLIFKGKVLDDHHSLTTCKLVNGSKIMLLAAQGATQPARVTSTAAAAKKPKVSSNSSNSANSGSSLLAHKMADMARSQHSTPGTPSGLAERRAAWSKTGIIALRDLQLTALEASWLEGLNEAKAADFSHNRLAALPHSLCQLLSLASLKLSHNCLQDAGVPWSELCSALSSSLNTLQLGNNQLQQVPACLQQLTALTHLGLEGNQLQHIEAGALEGLGKLEVLQLQDNQLQELPQDLGACSSLVVFNSSRNQLTRLPDSITRLAKLQVLAVDANKLAQLPAQLLSGCSSLCTLCAHQNPITVEDLRAAEGYAEYEVRRQARASKQLGGRVMADTDRAFSEGADVEQWQRWAVGPTGLGSDGSGRAGKR